MIKIFRTITFLICLLAFSAAGWASGEGSRVFQVINASDGLADNSAQTIKATITGRMVITTIGHVNFYDGTVFSHIDSSQEIFYPLPKYTGHYHLYFDHHHHLWLKDKRSVTCVNLTTERFIPNVDSVFTAMGVKGKVEDLFVDMKGNVFVLQGNQVFCIDLGTTYAVDKGKSLQDLEVYNEKMLMLVYDTGELVAYDLQTAKILYRTTPFGQGETDAYSRSSVLQFYQEGFFQIRNGEKASVLLWFDIDARQWRTIMKTPYHMNNMALKDDRLYIASEYGYWVYDVSRDVTEHYPSLTLTSGRKLETDINAIGFDRQGGMWIGTERRGLLYSKPVSSPFHALTWDNPEALRYAVMFDKLLENKPALPRHVNCEYRDSRGWLWTGTYTGLKLEYEADGEKHVRYFTRKDGLLNDMVHSVVEDNQQNIWVSTSYGVAYLFIEKGRVKFISCFNQDDHVPNETFVNDRAMKLDDGTVVMQMLDHVLKFNPADFTPPTENPYKLYPKMIKLLVNGEQIEAQRAYHGQVILEKAVSRTKEFSVRYDQNTLTLTFSALNFFRPLQTYYRVTVRGVERDSVTSVYSYFNSGGIVDRKGLLHLPLVNLRPGTYQVEVQASMYPYDWNMLPFVVTIHVEEPWWRTTGIMSLLLLSVIGLVVANLLLYNKIGRKRVKCANAEAELIQRINGFADRSSAYSGELLVLRSEDVSGDADTQLDVSDQFVDVMLRAIPYMKEHRKTGYTMSQLAAAVGIDVTDFYQLVRENLNKSPRRLSIALRLRRAADLLVNRDYTVEEISDECGFSSVNYFIARFTHDYGMNPKEYRQKNKH